MKFAEPFQPSVYGGVKFFVVLLPISARYPFWYQTPCDGPDSLPGLSSGPTREDRDYSQECGEDTPESGQVDEKQPLASRPLFLGSTAVQPFCGPVTVTSRSLIRPSAIA